MGKVTYAELYAYLRKLDFVDSSRSGIDTVFQHSPSGVVLVFSMAGATTPVRDADLLSVEVRLQHHELLSGSILDAIHSSDSANLKS